MVGTIALLLTLQNTWNLPLLSPQYFPNPTGQNGAEEYLAAMDVLRKGQFVAYSDWQSPETRRPVGSLATRGSWDKEGVADRNYQKLSQRLDTLTTLAFRQEEAVKFKRALELVADGNRKQFQLPPADIKAKFPPVADTIYLAHLAADSAYVELSKGRSELATQDIVNGMILSSRIEGEQYMMTLVASLDRELLMHVFAGNMARFTPPDLDQFDQAAAGLLKQPPAFVEALKKDVKRMMDDVEPGLKRLADYNPASGEDKSVGKIPDLLKAASSDARAQMASRIRASIVESCDVVLRRFQGPEIAWLPDTDFDPAEPSGKDFKSLDDIEQYLSQMMLPPAVKRPTSILRDMQSRCQLRLMRLATRICAFRWTWDRLPKNLAELNLTDDYTLDPLSRQSFVYEVNRTEFKLYSKGWKERGKVDFFAFPGRRDTGIARP